MDSNKLGGKVVIVAGGAGLLGREFVNAVVENGGIAVIADADRAGGEELQKSLKSSKAEFIEFDITSKASIEKMASSLMKKHGKIDALVNSVYPKNANYGRKFEDVTYEDFCENIDMNLGGCFLLCQQLIAVFKKQGYGNIINIASIYGVIPPRFEIYEGTEMTMPVEYAAIKAAVIHLTKYFAKALTGCNIRVNAISPGGILNNQPEEFLEKYNSYGLSKGMLEAKDLNGSVIYLLSDDSQYVNGQNIIVDDGFVL
ncbi:MAG: SDR family oxidoreductase [Sedimentisphaerales bacterium]|nr:SDR family oxidoreductase [Sedimentisphaerales bacterium]